MRRDSTPPGKTKHTHTQKPIAKYTQPPALSHPHSTEPRNPYRNFGKTDPLALRLLIVEAFWVGDRMKKTAGLIMKVSGFNLSTMTMPERVKGCTMPHGDGVVGSDED